MPLNNANKLIHMNGHLAVLLISSLLLSVGQLAAGQFLQPQSHLGRLVQSITSPLVLTSAVGSGAVETDPSESSPYEPESMGLRHADQPRLATSQREQQPPAAGQYQPEAGHHFQHYQRQPQAYAASVPLQQAPSRGIPQRYRESQSSADHSGDDDEGSQMGPAGGQHFRHQRQQQQQPAAANANEQYQMGAYLGPTIDDKEIQGAFNSNDDRDDDDDTPGYDAPPRGGSGGLRQDAAANAYMTSQPLEGAGSQGRPHGNQRGAGRGAAQPEGGFDDESNADEDDAGDAVPMQRRPRTFRQSGRLSQAASQYRGNSQHYPEGGPSQSSMMAAANGYSPMGSSPFDLSSLMAAAAGAGNGQAYEVYNGDGSYPGYYPQQQQQQQQRQQGRRNQAASMQNPYGYNQMNGGQNQQRGAADGDDVDSDGDDD